MKVIPEINFESNNWKQVELVEKRNFTKYIAAVITAALKHIGFRCRDITVSLCFTSDRKMKVLNKEHRQKDESTNILSFSYTDEDFVKDFTKYKDSDLYLGDLIFAYETILKEAQEIDYPNDCTKETFQNHLSHLIVHGILHLFGYDHEKSEEEAEIMESLEIEILKELGIDSPYS